ncbi:hypothetical protein ABDI30_16805 [Paenibacillus cisolokensis]|uniref:WXG100 family type VII secretion target n=1 Tax=Paenibacillus cisolokensis TaxID=1658519 RepID=UPI003D28D6A2
MRISVEPESLRTLSRQLKQSGDEYLAITRALNEAITSLVWESSHSTAVMDEWQTAKRLGEHLGILLGQMSQYLQSKADQFQETDHEYRTILEHVPSGSVSPAALFVASRLEGRTSILPEYGNYSTVISNPSSVAAVVGVSSSESGSTVKQAALEGQGWTFTDPSLGIAN